MGAIVSREEPNFQNSEQYVAWKIENVRSAFNRYKNLNPESPPLHLNRKTFFDVFNDYTTLTPLGFLTIPMSEFDVYDVRKQNKVFAMEPFTVLAMLCESTFAEQIQFCFELFDFNSNNRLSKDELTILVSTLLNGLHRANVSVAPKTEEQEEKLAESVAEGLV